MVVIPRATAKVKVVVVKVAFVAGERAVVATVVIWETAAMALAVASAVASPSIVEGRFCNRSARNLPQGSTRDGPSAVPHNLS